MILSGGNIDPTLLIQVMRHGLTQAGRFLVVRTRIGDRPGELIKLLAARRGGARRTWSRSSTTARGWRCRSAQTEVELTLATRDEDHCDELRAALAERGYPSRALLS